MSWRDQKSQGLFSCHGEAKNLKDYSAVMMRLKISGIIQLLWQDQKSQGLFSCHGEAKNLQGLFSCHDEAKNLKDYSAVMMRPKISRIIQLL